MAEIVACAACGAKNRLGAPAAGQVPRCGRCKAALPWLVDADAAGFDVAVDAPVPVLVDLWAPWCGPCLQQAPVLEQVAGAHAGALKVVKVDVEKHPEIARRHRVQGIPMLVLYAGGEPRETWVGMHDRGRLEARLGPYLQG